MDYLFKDVDPSKLNTVKEEFLQPFMEIDPFYILPDVGKACGDFQYTQEELRSKLPLISASLHPNRFAISCSSAKYFAKFAKKNAQEFYTSRKYEDYYTIQASKHRYGPEYVAEEPQGLHPDQMLAKLAKRMQANADAPFYPFDPDHHLKKCTVADSGHKIIDERGVSWQLPETETVCDEKLTRTAQCYFVDDERSGKCECKNGGVGLGMTMTVAESCKLSGDNDMVKQMNLCCNKTLEPVPSKRSYSIRVDRCEGAPSHAVGPGGRGSIFEVTRGSTYHRLHPFALRPQQNIQTPVRTVNRYKFIELDEKPVKKQKSLMKRRGRNSDHLTMAKEQLSAFFTACDANKNLDVQLFGHSAPKNNKTEQSNTKLKPYHGYIRPITLEEQMGVRTANNSNYIYNLFSSMKKEKRCALISLEHEPRNHMSHMHKLNTFNQSRQTPLNNLEEYESLHYVRKLSSMGFQSKVISDWNQIKQPEKVYLYTLMRNLVTHHIRPNLVVRSGPVSFNCHLLVLQVYSALFMRLHQSENVLVMPSAYVTPLGFTMVYDWMLADTPKIGRPGIVELFNAANYLQIRSLMNQCWSCLDNDEIFNEDTAFMTYLEARIWEVEAIKHLMITRIHKFFLTLVASHDFVELDRTEVCTLLRCNSIGVNTEIEVFYAAIRWMDFDWKRRKLYIADLMNCVRFGLLPPWFLIGLPKEDFGPQVSRVIHNPEVVRLINEGMRVCRMNSEKRFSFHQKSEYDTFLTNVGIDDPIMRNYVFDEKCPYHRPMDDDSIGYISYTDFLTYLGLLQTVPRSHWQNYRTDDPLHVRYKAAQDRANFLRNYQHQLDIFQKTGFI